MYIEWGGHFVLWHPYNHALLAESIYLHFINGFIVLWLCTVFLYVLASDFKLDFRDESLTTFIWKLYSQIKVDVSAQWVFIQALDSCAPVCMRTSSVVKFLPFLHQVYTDLLSLGAWNNDHAYVGAEPVIQR